MPCQFAYVTCAHFSKLGSPHVLFLSKHSEDDKAPKSPFAIDRASDRAVWLRRHHHHSRPGCQWVRVSGQADWLMSDEGLIYVLGTQMVEVITRFEYGRCHVLSG